jgi:hypothetical protein
MLEARISRRRCGLNLDRPLHNAEQVHGAAPAAAYAQWQAEAVVPKLA